MDTAHTIYMLLWWSLFTGRFL